MLNKYEHKRAQGYYPQQIVIKLGSAGNVGCPVPRVDEPDGYEKAGAKKSEQKFR